jgi:hypothetical protein
MKSRLSKVAKYLSSQGMYEEAAQIKKVAMDWDAYRAGQAQEAYWEDERNKNVGKSTTPDPFALTPEEEAERDAQLEKERAHWSALAKSRREEKMRDLEQKILRTRDYLKEMEDELFNMDPGHRFFQKKEG